MTNKIIDPAIIAPPVNAANRQDLAPAAQGAELSSKLAALVGLVGILLAALIVFIAADGNYDVYQFGGVTISQRFFVFCAFILLCLATAASLFCMGARGEAQRGRSYALAFWLTAASLPLTFLAVIFSV